MPAASLDPGPLDLGPAGTSLAPSADLPGRQGLSAVEAAARLKRDGYNELPQPDRRTPLRIIGEVLREPMLALLLAGGGIYMLLGSLDEALILLGFATFSVVVTVVQETRTERVLEALRDLTSPRALVIRDGQRARIAGREVVRGDLIVLSEGDRVPADALLIEAQDLQADESLLTGESVPVRKHAAAALAQSAALRDGRGPVHPESAHSDPTHSQSAQPDSMQADRTQPDPALRPGGDDLPTVYSGSLVVRGSGIAEVRATGSRSEIGKIGESLGRLETEPPRLQQQTQRLVRVFAVFGLAVSLLAVLLFGLLRGGWLDAILAGITIGMSMLPEEFPVVLTVFMAMGAWRISRARVLTRRAAAIETLGSATVLCTDKTGTLTENRMTIAELRPAIGSGFGKTLRRDAAAAAGALPEECHALVEFGILASARDPFDPMEKAFHDLGRSFLAETEHLHGADWQLRHAYALRPDLLAMAHLWQRPDAATGAGQEADALADLVVAAKGAPEAIADLCRLAPEARAAMTQAVNAMAAGGMRVLGVARASFAVTDPAGDGEAISYPPSQRDFDYSFLGLVGLTDPLRASVPAAVAECRSAGIRVIMITGDYPATAHAIARQAGIIVDGDAGSNVGGDPDILSGEELARLNDTDLARRLRHISICARIMPEQKLRIVEALKANGEVVAMTGDGVNDAPSLKAAHIGIAMGARGTDVAREASSIVLLDDDFGSVVAAVRLGRRIYDNLRKAIGFILAVHVPIAGLALLPLLFGLPLIFGPVHIAFLEMVIDPVCSLVFEAEVEERNVMRRPPRPPSQPLFTRALTAWSLLQGVVVLALVAAIYLMGLGYFSGLFSGAALDMATAPASSPIPGMPETEVRALTFFSLVLSIVGLILVNRSFSASMLTALRRPNPALGLVLLAVAAMLGLTLGWPAARDLFRFGPLHADDLALTIGAGLAVFALLELLKALWRKRLAF
ncbi:MAG TPA: cation-translocating P-type ATPase [Terriglobia bacterium]|nr:cation-translocating P-type ATPase [Terriglobia bacterium]